MLATSITPPLCGAAKTVVRRPRSLLQWGSRRRAPPPPMPPPPPPPPAPTKTPTENPTQALTTAAPTPSPTDAEPTPNPTAELPTPSPTSLEVVQWLAGFSDSSARTKTVSSKTVVSFQWTGTHDVYRMTDEAAYNSCDFGSATLVGSTSPVAYTASTTGTLYFACSVGSHCTSGQKLQLTVTSATSSPTDLPTQAPTTKVPMQPPTPPPSMQASVPSPASAPTATSIARSTSQVMCDGADGSWSAKPYADIETNPQKSIVFQYNPMYHDLLQFPDEAQFNACDFTGATVAGSSTSSGSQFEITSPGTYFLGCSRSMHCTKGQKLRVTALSTLAGSVTLEGISMSDFNTIRAAFKAAMAETTNTTSERVRIDSIARRGVTVKFSIDTACSSNAAQRYLQETSQNGFTSRLNQQIAQAGVTGVVVSSTQVNSVATTDTNSNAPMARSSYTASASSSGNGDLLLIIVIIAAGVAVIIAAVALYLCRRRHSVCDSSVAIQGKAEPQIEIITQTGCMQHTNGKHIKPGLPRETHQVVSKSHKSDSKYAAKEGQRMNEPKRQKQRPVPRKKM